MNIEMLNAAMKYDAVANEAFMPVDYGLDLELLEKIKFGEESTYFPNHLIPNNPKINKEKYKIEELKNKEDKVPRSALYDRSLFGNRTVSIDQEIDTIVSDNKVQEYNDRKKLKDLEVEKAYEKYLNFMRFNMNFFEKPREKMFHRQNMDDIVLEQKMGHGQATIHLKNWVVHKGKGAMRVNKMFKRCVHNSHRPSHMQEKDKNKNMLYGPRRVSIGHGVKH